MSERRWPDSDRHRPGRYEIRVTGHLDSRWAAWFDGLRLTRTPDGLTVIDGQVTDQAALHGLLQRVRDAGLPLVSVTRVDEATADPDSDAQRPPHPLIERIEEP